MSQVQYFGTNKPYDYDANGNRIRDLNKGILRIDYNVLNLPEYIYLKDGSYEHITYDADGRKLESTTGWSRYSVTVPETGILTTNIDSLEIRAGLIDQSSRMVYTDDFIYNSSYYKKTMNGMFPALGIDHVQLPNGYARHIGDKELLLSSKYVTDYLGNNRFVVTGSELAQSNNYYPYGGIWDKKVSASSQLWKFGGKELDSHTNIYFWNFRNYEPTIGGFFTPDPLAAMNYSMSPYTFAFNNPINYIELLGLRSYKVDEISADFDPKNDIIELPSVFCMGKAPITFDTLSDGYSKWAGRINGYIGILSDINEKYNRGSVLSKPLWETAKKIKKMSPYLASKMHLSRFHPSSIYRSKYLKAVTNNLNILSKYTEKANRLGNYVEYLKITTTGDIHPSTLLNVIVSGSEFIPIYGPAISVTYLLLDTGVDALTGSDIGEHLDNYIRENEGFDTYNIYDQTIK